MTPSKGLQKAMNDQVRKEFESAYLYLSMAAWMEDQTLPGFAAWLRLQAREANQKVNKVDQAKLVGKAIAEKAVGAGIKSIRFDRNGYLYHGRVKPLAEGAREGGIAILIKYSTFKSNRTCQTKTKKM